MLVFQNSRVPRLEGEFCSSMEFVSVGWAWDSFMRSPMWQSGCWSIVSWRTCQISLLVDVLFLEIAGSSIYLGEGKFSAVGRIGLGMFLFFLRPFGFALMLLLSLVAWGVADWIKTETTVIRIMRRTVVKRGVEASSEMHIWIVETESWGGNCRGVWYCVELQTTGM